MHTSTISFYVCLWVCVCISFTCGSDGKESACNAGDPGIYHIFIHSLAEGRIGCFNVLAIVNSCYAHWGAWIFLIHAQGLHGSSIFSSLRTSILFSTVVYQCTFPPTVSRSYLFSMPSTAFVICRLFVDGQNDHQVWGSTSIRVLFFF